VIDDRNVVGNDLDEAGRAEREERACRREPLEAAGQRQIAPAGGESGNQERQEDSKAVAAASPIPIATAINDSIGRAVVAVSTPRVYSTGPAASSCDPAQTVSKNRVGLLQSIS